ncbi:MAG: hypothetical protein LQ349_008003 [Xanthoria aureola]|nr:MAG: hypothetical protein LQ349_008003 [Xanthoria aureola]
MAEVFATFAGVASLIDVALRACNVLYDSCRYLRDAPQLSQRLRRTIQSVESVLRSVNESGATYRQQQTSAGLPDFLPSAVNDEIKSIKAELNALSTLLPTSSSSDQFRSKLKWVLDRKKVTEAIKALDSHQNTLILSLQTFAQRNGIELHNDLVRRLEHIHRQGKDSTRNLREDAKNLRDELALGNASLHANFNTSQADIKALHADVNTMQADIKALHANVNTLHANVNTSQADIKALHADVNTMQADIKALDANVNTLHANVNTLTQTSQAPLPAQESVKSSLAVLHGTILIGQDTLIEILNTILTALTKDVLARLFRAELRRVIIPAGRQCFHTFPKGSYDNQFEEIKKKVDEMAYQLDSAAGLGSWLPSAA